MSRPSSGSSSPDVRPRPLSLFSPPAEAPLRESVRCSALLCARAAPISESGRRRDGRSRRALTSAPPSALLGAVEARSVAVCHSDVTGCRMSRCTRSTMSRSIFFSAIDDFGLAPPSRVAAPCEVLEDAPTAAFAVFVSGSPVEPLLAGSRAFSSSSAPPPPPPRRPGCALEPPSLTSWRAVPDGSRGFGYDSTN